MTYSSQPKRDLGSRATILEVARLGKSMSMAADPETYNCASRQLFDAERLGSRFAALCIVNMALRVESALHHPRVVKAVEHVFKLANLPGDLAALTPQSPDICSIRANSRMLLLHIFRHTSF